MKSKLVTTAALSLIHISAKLDELLHPVFDKKAITNAQVITKGLPASPGAATGPVVFFAAPGDAGRCV